LGKLFHGLPDFSQGPFFAGGCHLQRHKELDGDFRNLDLLLSLFGEMGLRGQKSSGGRTESIRQENPGVSSLEPPTGHRDQNEKFRIYL
jgi:hypothetical protein